MSNLEVWLIVILILGVIVSNFAALRYSTKFKLPQFGQRDKKRLRPDEDTPAASPHIPTQDHSPHKSPNMNQDQSQSLGKPDSDSRPHSNKKPNNTQP
ncbi:MAG: DUF2897 family protein [Shewanella sp.]